MIGNDFYQHSRFCSWAISQIDNFFETVMSTDDVTFRKNGSMNRRNVVNPRGFRRIDNKHR